MLLRTSCLHPDAEHVHCDVADAALVLAVGLDSPKPGTSLRQTWAALSQHLHKVSISVVRLQALDFEGLANLLELLVSIVIEK